MYFIRERSKSSRQFSRQNFSQPYFQGRCRGHGRWGKPIFLTRFFSFFISFSRRYGALHRQARDYFSVIQLLPIIAHIKIASHDPNRSQLNSPPLTIPSPRLRSRRVWRSSLLTRIDSVSVFLCLAILTIGQNFGSNYRRSPEENFFITFRHRRGTPSQLP